MGDVREGPGGDTDVVEFEIPTLGNVEWSFDGIVGGVAVAGTDQADAMKVAGQNVQVVGHDVFVCCRTRPKPRFGRVAPARAERRALPGTPEQNNHPDQSRPGAICFHGI